MNKLNSKNSKKGSFLKNHQSNEKNKKFSDSKNKSEKVLCEHCGRTANNGIRCLGMCVADNDY